MTDLKELLDNASSGDARKYDYRDETVYNRRVFVYDDENSLTSLRASVDVFEKYGVDANGDRVPAPREYKDTSLTVVLSSEGSSVYLTFTEKDVGAAARLVAEFSTALAAFRDALDGNAKRPDPVF